MALTPNALYRAPDGKLLHFCAEHQPSYIDVESTFDDMLGASADCDDCMGECDVLGTPLNSDD